MPARKPRPKRAVVERLRDGCIKEYYRGLRQCLEPPPTPQAVARDVEWVARFVWDVALCQAWLGEAEQARAWLTRASRHYHELFALPLRADDPEVRAKSRWICTALDAARALPCLMLAGSPAQRQDCATLFQRFNEPQGISIDYMPIHRLYVCTLRDVVAGDVAGCRHWAAQGEPAAPRGEEVGHVRAGGRGLSGHRGCG